MPKKLKDIGNNAVNKQAVVSVQCDIDNDKVVVTTELSRHRVADGKTSIDNIVQTKTTFNAVDLGIEYTDFINKIESLT